jgi:hypothetical protein
MAEVRFLGNRQILAGYYNGPVEAIRGWLKDAQQIPGIVSVIYTAWQQRYQDLAAFAEQLRSRD